MHVIEPEGNVTGWKSIHVWFAVYLYYVCSYYSEHKFQANSGLGGAGVTCWTLKQETRVWFCQLVIVALFLFENCNYFF